MDTEQEYFQFSKPLKLRLIEYFRKEYDLDINDEEADLFLASLAALYDALSKAPATVDAAAARERDARPGAGGSDLISPHSC